LNNCETSQLTTAGLARRAALVIGLDSHGLAVARALADACVDVFSLERDQRLPGAKSNRIQRIFTIASFEPDVLFQRLLEVRDELADYDDVVLIANNDRQVEAIALNIDALRAIYRVSWADSTDVVLTMQRKSALQHIALQQGLNYPKSFVFETETCSGGDVGLAFPIILKPVRPLSSFKALVATSRDQLDDILTRYRLDLPILAQEYVAGGDDALFFGALLLDQGEVLFELCGRKVASHPPALGQTIIAETVREPEALRLTRQFFAGSGLSGPVSLELKRAPDGSWWVIEPTVGRTDFWAELCIAAGFNQPLMEFQVACGLPATYPGQTQECVWYDTERAPLAYAYECLKHWTLRPRARRQAFPYFGHGDPAPALAALLRAITRRLGTA
jgi:predicted ATP-grasp superfamily ATP-dependent carboligase